MATIVASPPYTAATAESHNTGIWSWLTTVDHKRIGALYLVSALSFFILGGLEAALMRAQLARPNGTVVSAEMFNQLFTMHGTTMIFLGVMPLSAAFFNFLIPLQIGARDVAFPRLNAFSYWIFLMGGLLITFPIFFSMAPNGGWFGYAPLSTKAFSPQHNMDFWVLGLQILGISSLAAAFNFITTIINMRAPGMTLMRMPVFTWMSFVVQFLVALAFPVITVALVFLQFDRFFGTRFYDIAKGADPLLWQHLFWVFGHPEVYILILPAFGLVSEVLPTFSRKPLFGYPVMVYSGILIGFLGFGVWAHHMFSVGMGPIADAIFSLTTMLIAIPTGVKIFNWMATMWGGSLRFTVAMKFAVALVGMFTIGGISGVMHSSPPADLQQTDTYFVVAHFHYVLFGGSILGLFAGLYYYFPKITGRFMDEKLGNWHFWITLIGFNLTFFPMHFAGLLGMPRRIYQYDAGQGYELFNMLSSIGTAVLMLGTLFGMINLIKSLRNGAPASSNPWGAATLEWSIPSPPPEYNFAELPDVKSRYPLWNLKAGAQLVHETTAAEEAGKHIPTAKELGIVLPNPSIMPFLVAVGMLIMFSGLFFMEKNSMLSIGIIISGAAFWIASLYKWLTTPLSIITSMTATPSPERSATAAGALPQGALVHGAVSESHGGGHYTTLGLDNRKVAIWTFIGSECMLFASLISTYLIYKGKSPEGPYPHEAWTNPATGQLFKPILNIPVTSFSTFVLLMSSLAMVLALAAVQNRNKPKVTMGEKILGSSKLWLWATCLLGITFLGCQAYEFTSFIHEGLSIRTNLFGSSFFTLTGFHGAHVTAGVIWLFTLLAIDYKRGLKPSDATAVDIAALYWHFVDVVWIAIFTLIYLIK